MWRQLLDDLDLAHTDPGIHELLLDDDGTLSLTVDPTAFEAGLLRRLVEQLRGIGLSTAGVHHVRIETVALETGADIDPDGIRHLVAVGGAKGGVGRTTVTAALAYELADRGYDIGLFDCDLAAGDLVSVMGVDEPIRSTPDGRPAPTTVDGIQLVSVDLVAGDRPVVWRGAMVHDVLDDLLSRSAWDSRDIVLLDLPAGVGDEVYTTLQDVALDGAIIVGTPTSLGDAGRDRARSMFEANDIDILAEVATMVGVDGPFGVNSWDVDIEVPFDRELQAYGDLDRTLGPETTDAVRSIADAITETLTAEPEVIEDALDLRDLPQPLAEQQAVLEMADAPGGAPPLRVDDPTAIADLLTETFGPDRVDLIDRPEGPPLVCPRAGVE